MGVETMLLVGLAGSTAFSAGGSILGGIKEAKAGYRNQAMAEIDAKNSIADAIANAKIIRRQSDSVKSSAKAAVAAAGVDVNSKTARLIAEDINAKSDDDIYQTMLHGQQKAAKYRAAGKQYARAGEDAANAGMVQAGATVLGGYTDYLKGWKT